MLSGRRRVRVHGQHMLASPEIADDLIEASAISKDEVVLEIGTGKGMLTGRLCQKAKRVISFEIDRRLYESAARLLSEYSNLELRFGDAFVHMEVQFDVCVTSLPYSESLRFVKWLAIRSGSFKRCVAVLQSEFVGKITSSPGRDSYRAISVVAQNSFKIERLFFVENEKFDPPPGVLSEAVRVVPRKDPQQPFFDEGRIALLNKLFSFRGRLLSGAIKKIDHEIDIPSELQKSRIEDLSPNQFADLIPMLESFKA